MIKWIKSLIEKVFGKFCKCEEPIILKEETKPEAVKEVIVAAVASSEGSFSFPITPPFKLAMLKPHPML